MAHAISYSVKGIILFEQFIALNKLLCVLGVIKSIHMSESRTYYTPQVLLPRLMLLCLGSIGKSVFFGSLQNFLFPPFCKLLYIVHVSVVLG